jgi:hypothetical protein
MEVLAHIVVLIGVSETREAAQACCRTAKVVTVEKSEDISGIVCALRREKKLHKILVVAFDI